MLAKIGQEPISTQTFDTVLCSAGTQSPSFSKIIEDQWENSEKLDVWSDNLVKNLRPPI